MYSEDFWNPSSDADIESWKQNFSYIHFSFPLLKEDMKVYFRGINPNTSNFRVRVFQMGKKWDL